MDTSIIYNACFELASTLISKKSTLTIVGKEAKNPPEQIEIANKLNKIAYKHLWEIINNGGNEEILVRAINYINYVHVLPPLKGGYTWFDEMLYALLEITCPNIVLDKKPLLFLDDIEKGLRKARKNSKTSFPK